MKNSHVIFHKKFPSLGITLEIEYDYEPPERQTFHHPGCDASIEVTEARLQTKHGESLNLLTLADELGASAAILKFLQDSADQHSIEYFYDGDPPDTDTRDPWESRCEF